jgi:hypothetical protein
MKTERRIYLVYPGWQEGTWYVSAVASNPTEATHSLHMAAPGGRHVSEAEAQADSQVAAAISRWKAGDDSVADLWERESEKENEELFGDGPAPTHPMRGPLRQPLRLVKS